ncbi:glycosyl transferase group 1 [Desulfocucumis palustris]|uniref:Glycosyl transferase group 1 n=1 Tax=Desulfocucumis palustris TaxID=1898651 RepID=A0A2L2X8F6_9FIRM|nr:glycosyltransferase family 4 protein [Desulfocucumis palustris]GBF32455.1 glycosyl transferase group 1 [Desulfocucumis palustris]
MKLRVLFQTRPDYLKNIAGDSIQVIKTKEYLEKLGAEVTISASPTNLSHYDIIHLFNTTRVKETHNFFKNAKKQNKPVVVSTIYWDFSEFCRCPDSPEGLYNNWVNSQAMRKAIFRGANLLLPNSRAEAELIKSQTPGAAPCHVVPNGADQIFALGDPDEFYRLHGFRDFILCVARICPRKNQLGLAEALKGTGLVLVLAGPVNDREYAARCRSAYPGVLMLNQVEHRQLPGLYAAAMAHVLPSWFETPGLASLEAGLAGCRIVTTDRGTAGEYFGHLATYCDPGDTMSIRDAVIRALNLPDKQQNSLKYHISNNYLWQNAAMETLRGYETVLSVTPKFSID